MQIYNYINIRNKIIKINNIFFIKLNINLIIKLKNKELLYRINNYKNNIYFDYY